MLAGRSLICTAAHSSLTVIVTAGRRTLPNRPAAFPAWPLWQTATPPTPSTVAWPLGRSGMAVNGSRGQIGPFGDVSALSGRFAAVLHQFLPPTKKQNQCRVGLPEALMQVNEEY